MLTKPHSPPATKDEANLVAQQRAKDKRARRKTVIGWSESVDFPCWHIFGLSAKVDTGARTSALHVEDLKVVSDDRVQFYVILDRDHRHKRVKVEAPVLRWGRVRSSSGHFAQRCFVRTVIRLGETEKEIDISLVSREKMIFRMLLGRRALAKDFLVDVSKRHVVTPRKRRVRRGTKE